MTRLEQWRAAVTPKLSDIYALAVRELAARPVGDEVVVRLPKPFAVSFTYEATLALSLTYDVRVMKTPDGFVYGPHDPLFYNRKGRTVPKLRPLPVAA